MAKKKKPEIKDPPRYPKVINGYETEAIRIGKETIHRIVVDLTKKMVKEAKSNK